MYEVSASYKNQIKLPVAEKTLRGTVGSVSFTENDIVAGMLSITNQCAESGELKLGSVYTGTFSCTFVNGLVERDTWKGSIITIEEGLKLSGGTYEYVPLGIYTVDEATYGENGVIVTAYDNMLKFDKSFFNGTTQGTAYALLSLACTTCGVTLGTTAGEMANMPNGTVNLVLYTENDIQTWRDLVYWVSQTLCAFATIDRQGRLVIRYYGNSLIDTVSQNLRFEDSQFSDYTTEYTGISFTDLEANKYVHYGLNPDNKLTYNLGANPFLQYGSDFSKRVIAETILARLHHVQYVPFSVKMLHGPVYDLGDVFKFTGGRADGNKQSCVMFWEYTFSGGFHAEGYGSDPAAASAQSKTDKQLQSILNNSKANEIRFYSFMNAAQISIADGNETNIVDIRFASLKSCNVIFQAEILLQVSATVSDVLYKDAVGTVKYIMDESEEETYHPIETWTDSGKHILHLFYYMQIDESALHHLVVKLNMSGGAVTIAPACCRAVVYGQGLAAEDNWDGMLDFEQAVAILPMSGEISVETLVPEVSVLLTDMISESLTETAQQVPLSGLSASVQNTSFSGYFSYTAVLDDTHYPLYDPTGVELVDGTYRIISGATVPQIMTMPLIQVGFDVATITNVAMELTNCTFRFSTDGSIWKSYSGGSWQALSAGMTAAQVLALTSSQWLELVTDELHVEITMTDANSTVTSFSLEYTEEI